MIPPCARSVLLSRGVGSARQHSDLAAAFGRGPSGREPSQATADDENVGL